MISVPLARRLASQGLEWTPSLHDFFMIPDRDLEGHVFVISELTIDVDSVAGHATIMFNGAVEWSLDYILSQDAVWLPTETQLRELLGGAFAAMTLEDGAYRCEIRVDGVSVVFAAETAEDAYGNALLHLRYAETADIDSLHLEEGAT